MPGDGADDAQPIALAYITGIVREVHVRRNEWNGEAYFWLLIDTYGGEIDVVADMRLFDTVPVVDGIIQGEFYISGQLINAQNNYDLN
jgi:hypothetical protein